MDDYLIDKQQMRQAFSRAASQYDQHAVLQQEVAQRMMERLEYIKLQPDTILDAGSGTGHGARQLSERYKNSAVISLDIALGMLQIANSSQSRWPCWLRRTAIRSVCADIEALPVAAQSLDMIWSNLALQWCNDLPQAFAQLSRTLRPDGLLMFSTFGPDTLKELRQAFASIDGHNHVNRFTDMHDIGDMLSHNGFAEPVVDMEYITLTYPDVRAVMQDLKAIGAQNATRGRRPGMMGRQTWQQLVDNYELLRQEGRLPATYEVIYGHAWKPQARKARDTTAVINFHRS